MGFVAGERGDDPGRALAGVELGHRPSQGLGLAEGGIVAQALESPRGQLDRGARDHWPVRDEKRAGAGIEERAGKA